jgi:hypothetical protein
MQNNKLGRVNRRTVWWGPRFEALHWKIIAMAAAIFPTFDSYRVKWDSTNYKWDNDG